jgi:hypothetical protein
LETFDVVTACVATYRTPAITRPHTGFIGGAIAIGATRTTHIADALAVPRTANLAAFTTTAAILDTALQVTGPAIATADRTIRAVVVIAAFHAIAVVANQTRWAAIEATILTDVALVMATHRTVWAVIVHETFNASVKLAMLTGATIAVVEAFPAGAIQADTTGSATLAVAAKPFGAIIV